MSKFIIRVELHSAKEKTDYDKLHEEMKKEGFKRTIIADNGMEYHLPTAEYYKEIAETPSMVLESAKTAANKTGKANSIIVAEFQRASWHNLPTTNE